MLIDAANRALKPNDKIHKLTVMDGMYVRVDPSGTVSFGLDDRLNGRRAWPVDMPMADNTRAMRRSIFEREPLSVWRNRLPTKITLGVILACFRRASNALQ